MREAGGMLEPSIRSKADIVFYILYFSVQIASLVALRCLDPLLAICELLGSPRRSETIAARQPFSATPFNTCLIRLSAESSIV